MVAKGGGGGFRSLLEKFRNRWASAESDMFWGCICSALHDCKELAAGGRRVYG